MDHPKIKLTSPKSKPIALNHKFGRGLVNKKHDPFDHDHDPGHCLTSHQNFTYLDIYQSDKRQLLETVLKRK